MPCIQREMEAGLHTRKLAQVGHLGIGFHEMSGKSNGILLRRASFAALLGNKVHLHTINELKA